MDVASTPGIAGSSEATFTIGKTVSVDFTAVGVPTPTLTETGALPAGITFTDNGDGTASLAGVAAPGTAGEYPITITATNRVGSATHAFTLTVAKQTSIVTISAPATAVSGGNVTIAIEVGGGDPPSGTVDLTVNGVALASVVLDAAGHATLTTSALPLGQNLIEASYRGDDAFLPASGSATVTILAVPTPAELADTGVEISASLLAAELIAAGTVLLFARHRRRASETAKPS